MIVAEAANLLGSLNQDLPLEDGLGNAVHFTIRRDKVVVTFDETVDPEVVKPSRTDDPEAFQHEKRQRDILDKPASKSPKK